jgi:hypothetical protein
MKNDHHQPPHAFIVALWLFPSPQGNASKLGLNLDCIIFHVPKKNIKLSRLVFKKNLVVVNQFFSSNEVFRNFL